MLVSAEAKIVLSRDKRSAMARRISVWHDGECPKPNRCGLMAIYVGNPIATIMIEDLEKMGKEFVPKPGGTVDITMEVD